MVFALCWLSCNVLCRDPWTQLTISDLLQESSKV